MNKSSLLIRTGIILAVTLIALYLVFGPRDGFTGRDLTWAGMKENLAENINLGLDLKGGSQLEMRVRTDEYLKRLTENNREAAIVAAKDANVPVAGASSVAQNETYQVTLQIADPAQRQGIIDAVKQKVDFSTWTESTTDNGVTWSLPVQQQTLLGRQAVDQALQIIEGRINAFGVKEPTLQRLGSENSARIILQMPGVDDPERVKALIGAESSLELMKVAEPYQEYPTKEAAIQALGTGGQIPANRRVLPYDERDDAAQNNQNQAPQARWLILEAPAIITGDELRDAQAYSQTGTDGDYKISFSLKPNGAQKFGEWTGKNIGKYMAVVLDGKMVKSAATIQSQIFDSGEITGRFSKTSAEDLALTLKSGALPAPIEYLEERTVGPSLGADSIRAGVSASVGGLVFVIIFMLIYYRGAGVNAVVALLLNMLLTVAALVMIDSTLTLPGIAGLILGIGMAVDSNVLIFERIREELRAGKSVAEAVVLGFDRAFVTIIDTHLTTIISSVILYMYGSSQIRGFAVTLILGLLINLFSAVFVSRTIFNWLLSRNQNMQKLSI